MNKRLIFFSPHAITVADAHENLSIINFIKKNEDL